MSKIKKINIIQIVVMTLLVISMVVGIIYISLKIKYKLYYSYMVLLYGLTLIGPILMLIFQLIKEAKILEYSSKAYFSFQMILIIIFGVGIHLGISNFIRISEFSKYALAFYIALPIAIAIPIVVGIVLEKRRSTTNGPKIVSK